MQIFTPWGLDITDLQIVMAGGQPPKAVRIASVIIQANKPAIVAIMMSSLTNGTFMHDHALMRGKTRFSFSALAWTPIKDLRSSLPMLRASFPARAIERSAASSVSVQRRVLYGARCVVICPSLLLRCPAQ